MRNTLAYSRSQVERIERSAETARAAGGNLVIEYPASGATYDEDAYGVYEYGTYGKSSVLRGQDRRQFVGSYDTLAEARAAHPKARITESAADARVERGR